MTLAFAEAEAAGWRGEVPVGAVLIGADGALIAASGNRVEERHDPTSHAEMVVLREATAKLGAKQLDGCDLYATLEPCPMCAAAISLARIRRLYFGAYDPKGGGVEHGARVFAASSCLHRPEVIGGVRETEAAEMLRQFFQDLRGRD